MPIRNHNGQPGAAQPRVSTSLAALPTNKFGYEQARHLLWRAGFGGSPQQIQTLVSWGLEKSVDHLLNPGNTGDEPIASDLFDKEIMRPPSDEDRQAYRKAQRAQDEDLVAKFRKMRQEQERKDRAQITDMQKWWLKRMIETPKPLEEKITLFWHGHFATSYRTIENSFHMFKQNELFRTHGLGNFGDILFGIIRDPAMLAYLNNNQSRKDHPNENLAREIMELFSLGVGGYSEKDIKEGARALTGYTFKDDQFVFDKNNHDTGKKNILGKISNADGDDFVRTILGQRACAQFVARKLYGFFVNDLPPVERLSDREMDEGTGGVIRHVAGTLLSHRYEIKPALKQLFMSQHFYDPAFLGQQVKSPVQLVVGAVRSMTPPTRDLSILNDALDLMGQNLFYPPSVKGWEGGRAWINTSTLFVRQNILAFLLTGKKPVGYDATADTQKYDPMPLLAELDKADPGAASDPVRVVEYLLRLTTGAAPVSAREPLVTFVQERGGHIVPDLVTALLLLITASPEYQLC